MFKCRSPYSCFIVIMTAICLPNRAFIKATPRPLLLDTSKGRQAATVIISIILIWIGELEIVYLWLPILLRLFALHLINLSNI